MEINDIRKMQQLLKTATESINEAMAIASQPEVDGPRKRQIYVTQQRPKHCKGDKDWTTIFADTDYDNAIKWVDSHNANRPSEYVMYRVIEITLYLD